MLKIRCKNCNVELNSHPIKTKCCGCDNLTTVTGDKITGIDLSLIELISSTNDKSSKNILSKEDLMYQESRRSRKIKRLEFDIK
jgi:hypothetical protein